MSLTPEQRAVLTVTEGALHDLAEVDDLPGQNLSAHVIALVVSLAEARRDAEWMRGILHEIADDAPTEDTTMEDATSGGQFDDAFYGGYDAGVYMCAQIARKGIDAARAAEEKTT